MIISLRDPGTATGVETEESDRACFETRSPFPVEFLASLCQSTIFLKSHWRSIVAHLSCDLIASTRRYFVTNHCRSVDSSWLSKKTESKALDQDRRWNRVSLGFDCLENECMENFEKTASVARLVPKVPRPTEYEIHMPRPLALQDASKRVLIGRVSGPILAVGRTLLSVRRVKRLKT
jgi:hypothetical protein